MRLSDLNILGTNISPGIGNDTGISDDIWGMLASAAQVVRNKRVLITGAGGWIGSALTRALLGGLPEHLLLLDSAERNLYEIDSEICELGQDVPHASVLGTVTDEDMLSDLFDRYRPQFVFHAAACKHVPLMEDNPLAVVLNNAIGTYTLAKVARQQAVEQFVLLSTDKAADPHSIMGASKRIAELVVLSWDAPGTQAKALRLVNVLGSQGSVVPRFRHQIATGSRITVTHPGAQRYFETLQSAVGLLLSLAVPGVASGLYIPRVDEPIRIIEIARWLIAEHSPAKDIEIVFTGLRPGDKLSETLLSTRESLEPTSPEHSGSYSDSNAGSVGARFFRVQSRCPSAGELAATMQSLTIAIQHHRLEDVLQLVRRLVPEYCSDAIAERWSAKDDAASSQI